MSKVLQKFYIKVKTSSKPYWLELTGATTLLDAQHLADQTDNLGEIGVIHMPYGIKVISKKNNQGNWESFFSDKVVD